MRFNKGDVVKVSLNPVTGKEMQGDFCPCLVISPVEFNRLGTALVCPITQGGDFSRYHGFAVPLMNTGMDTQGVVLSQAVRSLDLQSRKAKKIEVAPDYIVDEVSARLSAILE